MNLNITEAEEEVVSEEISEDNFFQPKEEADFKNESESKVQDLEIDLVKEDEGMKLSVWEDDSLWDGDEGEVVWDLGKAEARDEV